MKIAFIPVGATGHSLAALPIAEELVLKGADVIFFAPENNRKRVEDINAHWFNMYFDPAAGLIPGEDFVACLPLVFLTQAKDTIDMMMEVLEKEKPDLLVVDQLALAGRLASAKLNIPMVMLHPTYVSNSQFSISRFWPTFPDDNPARAQAKVLAEQFSKEYGVEYLDIYRIFEGHADFNVVTLSRSFQPFGETFGDEWFFAGAQIFRNRGVWEKKDDKPLLYTSLGTTFNNWPQFYHMLFGIVKEMDINVICAIGDTLKAEELGEIPDNVTVMAFAPQQPILEKTDWFLTHAGSSSVMHSLYFGVPMLAFPQMEEQFMTANRMIELGVCSGSITRQEATEETLRNGLNKLMNDTTLKDNARMMSEEMHACGGCEKAAEKILEHFHNITTH